MGKARKAAARKGAPRKAAPRKGAAASGWRPKVVVCDVDGTITHKDRRIDAAAVEALREAEAAGVPVVLATGNVLPIAYALAYLVGTSGPIVAENGGLVFWKGEVERRAASDGVEQVARAVEAALGLKRLFTDRWRVTEVAFPEGRSTYAQVLAAARFHPRRAAVRIERTGFAVHIMDRDATKFQGVRRALELLGLAASDAVAIGDSDNDVDMIEGCRAGVALGDASARLKAAADYVAPSPAGGGIRNALEAYGVLKAPARGARGGRGRPRRAWQGRPLRSTRAKGGPRARLARRAPRAARPARRRKTRR